MGEVVSVSREGPIAVITIDSPPVNAMSQPVRQGLMSAFEQLAKEPSAQAVLITCAGRTFIAGADIKEFDTGVGPPGYHELFAVIEGFDRPVIAALFGTALGAGVEIALACHYRCAVPDAKLGLPEITLGIIPGAGGTQRLPRLIGAKAALELILSAAPIDGGKAHELGIVDEIVTGDLRAGAIAYAKKLVAAGAKPRPTAARTVDTTGFDDAFIKSALAGAAKKWRGQKAPERAVEAVRISTQVPLEEGIKRERKIATEADNSLESRALRHLFFAEREVARIPGLPESAKAKEIRSVGIVGAGTMGRGIAICFADAGIPVQIVDTAADAVQRGLDAIRTNYEGSVAKGRLTAQQLDQRVGSIKGGTDLNALASVDLVIEAAFENMAVKKDLFAKFDKICRADAILATNTSTLDVNEIAQVTKRPEAVIGLHFFSPANVMRLLEIVRGAKTSHETLATGVALAKKLRKVGVVVGVCFGFVGNRMMLEGYFREADQLLLEGATPEQVDRVVENFGFAMGPCKVNDMGGNDISVKARESVQANRPKPYHAVVDELVRVGRLGQKTNAGFYRYEPGNRTAIADPETTALIERVAQQYGIKRRSISDEEIEVRCIYPLINEGARILEEGIAYRSSDVDVIWTTGYGFPRFRGGPMFYADSVGLKNIHARISELHKQHGQYWKPAPLLEKLAASGQRFADFKVK
jgi:3-hydroxyacyl-CoA dehydrogenase